MFLAVRVLDLPALEKDRAFAWDDNVGSVAAIAAGYISRENIPGISDLIEFKDILCGTLRMPL